MSERLLTPKELSQALQVSVRQAQRLARRVRHYKVGRQLRFQLVEVLEDLREELETA